MASGHIHDFKEHSVFLILFIFILCVSTSPAFMSAPHLHSIPVEARKECWVPKTEAVSLHCRVSPGTETAGPLREQAVLSAAEPSFQPHIFKNRIKS